MTAYIAPPPATVAGVNWSGGAATLSGAGTGTGLAAGNSLGPLALLASTQALIDDVTHDFNVGLLVQNWTADGAGLVVGNPGRGDGLFAQAIDTSGFVGPANAVNVFAGSAAQQAATDTGTGGTVTYSATGLIDTAKAWTVNQWVNRWVVIGNFGVNAVCLYITSNTATQLVGTGGWLTQNVSTGALVATATPVNGTTYLIPNSNATGVNVTRYSTGNGIHLIGIVGSGGGWPGSSAQQSYLMLIEGRTNEPSIGIVDTGTTSASSFLVTTNSKTTGTHIQLFQGASAFSGDALLMDFANNAGTFTGFFEHFKSGGVDKWFVHNSGSPFIGGDRGSGTNNFLILTNTHNVGNGALTNMQAPLIGTGGGPATPTTIVDWLKVWSPNGGTARWIPVAA